MGSDSCKSCNIHPRDGYVGRICELNNKTRQMKPRDFQLRKGSNYYGYTRVSFKDFVFQFIHCIASFRIIRKYFLGMIRFGFLSMQIKFVDSPLHLLSR